jgi:hypothetical protein
MIAGCCWAAANEHAAVAAKVVQNWVNFVIGASFLARWWIGVGAG